MSATKRSPITTHVLDTSLGRPAAGIEVRLARAEDGAEVGRGVTDADGRAGDLMAPGSLAAGTYRIRFETGAYFAAQERASFYPWVEITFEVRAPGEHYHVPLLLNPFGYSTYRGS
jgi:5-hydroxyisourate hydrolase